jgi:GWxTD domain-containing protein
MPQAGSPANIIPPIPNLTAGGGPLSAITVRVHADDFLPYLAALWVAGVLLMHLRSLASWFAARRLRTRGVCYAPETWQQRLTQLQRRINLQAPVALLESCFTAIPAVSGYLRPVILVPVGMLVSMPAAQVEAILLHELAHVRRRDYLVNLLQIFVENLMFYHPAIWWISGVIRTERENCCDDLVVAINGDAREYASALTTLEDNRWAANEAVLAANGGNLMNRIKRILYPLETPRATVAPVLLAGLLTLSAALALHAWQTKPADEQDVHTRWLKEDVVYIIQPQEKAAFENLKSDPERDHFIEQFWERRNPNPGAVPNKFKEEHYRRISYANSRFGTQAGLAGWKTDRGRIYIQYGPPDELEDHPSGGPMGAPLQQWLYKVIPGVGERVIVDFVDKAGDGNYRMTMDPNHA